MKFLKYYTKVIIYRFLEESYRLYSKLLYKILFPGRRITFDTARVEQNIEKYGYITCKVGRRVIKVPLQNEFGKNYPVYATDVVHQLFDIKDDEIVVDVGGGNRPLKRANIAVDFYPGETFHRGEPLKLYPHQKFIQGDVQNLYMFKDKSIDFLFTMQTLEHVDDPARACAEIIRVAKRGFIDVPRYLGDIHMEHPEHKWFIDLVDGVLIFQRKPVRNLDSPFLGLYPLVAYMLDRRIKLMIEYYYRNISCVQLLWKDKFDYKVTD